MDSLDNVSPQLSHHPPPTHTRRPRGPTLPAPRLPDLPGRVAIPGQSRGGPGAPSPLERFNAAPAEDAERTLLACLNSVRWARRVAGHRPYPDPASLLAASDEAAYDLTAAELAQALAAEALPALPEDTYAAAHTALNAAYAAYEARFGHVFVICLDGLKPDAVLDHVLEGIRSRLANDPEEERPVAAEELRRLARGRLTGLLEETTTGHRPLTPDEPDKQGECPRPRP
ncbi:2-oxo-4-hydroxy-4-carboxy-5-ureidoimidazoline decarboxylase [Streptomyces griseomycini]|uniref:2-oxo-4-hydroxy-4-carboxy-5-ureidoimidazoline decarboxylase n=1 Tax=Streptomyces griseomycini TaxID=66895 RepID=UPI001612507A|nr:2-oxo-4-hydroxy-4-carboxy-5-ureidoimidazoline decarboxylase [Streptomyces griseomycini]GGP91708.1 2-oxo-4-hydroxy-4-carboxy-5-ureidoimidazoline decarboxylase [Streptomyces griseomycini]GGR14230.1 2-oxo-4-hydroxy-4-carboxy-5-ureidoimidazoline decarboxylase [Streptomyces griseomycini]